MTVIMMAVMISCSGGSSDPKSIHEKIANGTKLSQDDYNVMIDYIAEAGKKTMDAFNGESYEDIDRSMNDINKDYPYLQEFTEELEKAAANDKLNSDCQKKLDKINEEFYKEFYNM